MDRLTRARGALVAARGDDGARFPGALTAADAAWAHAQLAARARGELRPARSGVAPIDAATSSTALVAGAFAFWRSRPRELVVPGVDGPFTDVRLEERLAIPHGGGNPNLDVALDGPDGLVGIEAKLTEHLAPRRPRPWKPAYRRPAMRAALDDTWRAVFDDLREDRWAPRFLDAGQLVRHALSLRGAGTLVYLHWTACDDPFAEHAAELDALLDRVRGATPRLHALTYAALFDAWEPVAPVHVAALRARYDVSLGRGAGRPARG